MLESLDLLVLLLRGKLGDHRIGQWQSEAAPLAHRALEIRECTQIQAPTILRLLLNSRRIRMRVGAKVVEQVSGDGPLRFVLITLRQFNREKLKARMPRLKKSEGKLQCLD